MRRNVVRRGYIPVANGARVKPRAVENVRAVLRIVLGSVPRKFS